MIRPDNPKTEPTADIAPASTATKDITFKWKSTAAFEVTSAEVIAGPTMNKMYAIRYPALHCTELIEVQHHT